MFSIIIPLYNKEKYIAKTIESVLCQKYSNYELLIINDGSTDNSINAVKNFSDSKIRIIQQKNQGVSTARNNGIRAAKYDYITFLDADDWWHPDFLLQMKNLIEKYTDAGIYGSKYYWVKNGKERISQNGLVDDYTGYINYFQAYLHAWYMPLSSISTVIRKSVLIKLNGFKPNLKFGEDFDLWIRIALYYKIAYVNCGLAYYNQDVEKSNRALGKRIWKPENHYIFNLEYLEETESTNPELRKLLDGLRVRALIRYRLAGKYRSETRIILNKVDFSRQSKYYQRIYRWPLIVIKLYFSVKKTGSFIKQRLIKLFN